MSGAETNPKQRQDFVFLFDVTDGNPNGDPDGGNLPRIDPETMQGLVTDGAIKRKIRNYVDTVKGSQERYKIYVQNRGILNKQHERAYVALEKDGSIASPPTEATRKDFFKSPPTTVRDQARAWMCANFYDIRAFGAVMTTDINCGQVRGPVQLTFARSVDPILPLDVAITRVALTNAQDIRGGTAEDAEARYGQMGRKSIVPYGLYVCHGFVNSRLADDTGFNEDDLSLLYAALVNMWDHDRSASRGMMACRALIVFTHDSQIGNAPAHVLFDRVRIQRRTGVDVPRSYRDYDLTLAPDALPPGVALTRIV